MLYVTLAFSVRLQHGTAVLHVTKWVRNRLSVWINTFMWNVTPFFQVHRYQIFGENNSIHHLPWGKRKTADSTVTSANKTTCHHTPRKHSSPSPWRVTKNLTQHVPELAMFLIRL